MKLCVVILIVVWLFALGSHFEFHHEEGGATRATDQIFSDNTCRFEVPSSPYDSVGKRVLWNGGCIGDLTAVQIAVARIDDGIYEVFAIAGKNAHYNVFYSGPIARGSSTFATHWMQVGDLTATQIAVGRDSSGILRLVGIGTGEGRVFFTTPGEKGWPPSRPWTTIGDFTAKQLRVNSRPSLEI